MTNSHELKIEQVEDDHYCNNELDNVDEEISGKDTMWSEEAYSEAAAEAGEAAQTELSMCSKPVVKSCVCVCGCCC